MSKNSTGLPDSPHLSKFDGMGSCLSLLEEERKKRGINTGSSDYSDGSNPVLDVIDAWNKSMEESGDLWCDSMLDAEYSGYRYGYLAAIRDLADNDMLVFDKVLEAVTNDSFKVEDEHYIEESENRDCGIRLAATDKKEIFKKTSIPFLFKRQQVLISELKTQVANQQK